MGMETPGNRIGPMIGILALMALGVLFGWLISQGITGLPIYIVFGIMMALFTVWKPEVGIFSYLTYYNLIPVIPESLRLPGFDSGDSRIFGLNATNAILLVVVAVWTIRFGTIRRKWLRIGPFGKLILFYMAWMTFAFALAIYVAFTDPYADPLPFYIAKWRSLMIPAVLAFMVLQTEVDEKYLKRMLNLLVVVMLTGLAMGLYLVFFHTGPLDVKYYLRILPVDLIYLVPLFGILLAFFTISRSNMIVRIAMLTLALLTALPIGYSQRRGVYLAIVMEIVVLGYLLVRYNRRYLVGALVVVGISVVVGSVALPRVVEERVTETFIDPSSGKERIEGSAYARIDYAEVGLTIVEQRWWSMVWGSGTSVASTALTRRVIGHGRSLHNTWIESFIDYGIIGVVLFVAIYVGQFQMLNILVLTRKTYYTGLGLGLGAFLISVQGWAFTHTYGFDDQLPTMLWVIAALITGQLRPGGAFADLELPDGRLGKELLGYARDARPEGVMRGERAKPVPRGHRTGDGVSSVTGTATA